MRGRPSVTARESHFPGLELRQIEDVVDKPGERATAVEHDVQRFHLPVGQRPLFAPHEDLHVAEDASQGIAQVVSDVRNEIFFKLIKLAQFLGHGIELPRELAQFVLPRVDDAVA